MNEENYRLVENIRSENKELRKLRKTYKEDVDEENIAAIDIFFKARFSTLINVLKVTDSNYKEITSPLKYNNLSCGKGSEKSRAVLALYLSIWQTMEMNKSCFFPLFIDTPNQHEQDKVNYPTIINTISDNISTDTQIFICGLDNIALDKIKNISNITKLSNPILTKEKYAIFKDLF